MRVFFANGSLKHQSKDIPEPLPQTFEHQIENGDKEIYLINQEPRFRASGGSIWAILYKVELSKVQHGSGFKFSNHKSVYPTKAYRVVDLVTNEIIRVNGDSITFNLDDALQIVAQVSRSLLEVIDCFRVYDDETV